MFNGGMGNMQGMMKKVQKLTLYGKNAEELKLRTTNYSRRRCCHRSCQR